MMDDHGKTRIADCLAAAAVAVLEAAEPEAKTALSFATEMAGMMTIEAAARISPMRLSATVFLAKTVHAASATT